MAQADQIEALTAALWRLYLRSGAFAVVRFDSWDDPGRSVGLLAKASGQTPGQVEAQLRGEVMPTTGAALALLSALASAGESGPVLNGAASHG